MDKNNVLDIMLDLEFLGTEEDMIEEFPAQDAFPIVTSIGAVAQYNGVMIASKSFNLNFQEQLDNGAKFGKRCMLEFWTQQPLLGEELARTMRADAAIKDTLAYFTLFINQLKQAYPEAQVRVIGNNLLADNAKVVRLFAKYSKDNLLPWGYFDNCDYRETRKIAKYLGFDDAAELEIFEVNVEQGMYASLGFTEVVYHNAEFDCIKQLHMLNRMRDYLVEVKRVVKESGVD